MIYMLPNTVMDTDMKGHETQCNRQDQSAHASTLRVGDVDTKKHQLTASLLWSLHIGNGPLGVGLCYQSAAYGILEG